MEKRKMTIDIPTNQDNRCGRKMKGYHCDNSLLVYLSTQEKEILTKGCKLLGIRKSTLLREISLQVCHEVLREHTIQVSI